MKKHHYLIKFMADPVLADKPGMCVAGRCHSGLSRIFLTKGLPTFILCSITENGSGSDGF